jgi:hypothetical protein
MKAKPYIIVTHLPACSAVLHVDGPAVTILREDTRSFCEAFAVGYTMGSGLRAVQHRGAIDLPAGNPAISYNAARGEVSR